MNKSDALFELGVSFMEVLDVAFDSELTLDDIAAEVEYQISQARESGDYR